MTRLLLLIIVTLTAGFARAENLVANPGFEDLVGGVPARWQVYVEPMEGAGGILDTKVMHEGKSSVRLHNPRPYDKEPANNWSQNILRDLGGRVLQLKGFVKTDTATEASIWVQCCKKKPWAVLNVFSTDDATPVYGTRDWTPVEMRVEVPAATEYVVVRCVLKGQGTAWFDDVTVEDVGPAHQPPASKPSEASSAGSAGTATATPSPSAKPSAPMVKPIPPIAPATPAMPDVPKVTVPQVKTTSPLVPLPKKIEEKPVLAPAFPEEPAESDEGDPLKVLRDASKTQQEDNTALRRSNENLTREVEALRKEMETVKKDLRELKDRQTARQTLDTPADSRGQGAASREELKEQTQ